MPPCAARLLDLGLRPKPPRPNKLRMLVSPFMRCCGVGYQCSQKAIKREWPLAVTDDGARTSARDLVSMEQQQRIEQCSTQRYFVRWMYTAMLRLKGALKPSAAASLAACMQALHLALVRCHRHSQDSLLRP